ncbi:MAG: hypothetical protein OMM_10598, partial [Candidatus Magnetoglobus multicellularis str. Araruama]
MQGIEKLPPGKWWQMPDVVRTLKITNKEKTLLEQMFLKSRKTMIGIKSEMKIHELDMETLMESEPFNETAVKNKYSVILNTGIKLFEKQFDFLVEVRKLLGKNRFMQLRDHFHEKHRHKRGHPRQ